MQFKTLMAALMALVGMPLAAQDVPDTPKPVEVMILGTYHFANPGNDTVNMEVDDVLKPERQRELEALAQTLAEWKPTKIAVESQQEPPEFAVESYARAQDLLGTSRDETVQIGFRLALLLGHEVVFGFDERAGDGEPDYFPFGKMQEFAEASGQGEIVTNLIGGLQERMKEEEAKLASQSIPRSLMKDNDPSWFEEEHNHLYYTLLRIGDGDNQPGAELNAYWYMRNAKMFAKLDLIAEPGDRVFVLVGSGHATWLRDFVKRMPGYTLVESLPYVERAAERSKTFEGPSD